MMKNLGLVVLACIWYGCTQPDSHEAILQSRIDSLENAVKDSYKPGFGEFMISIQAHHAKLWFAGMKQNWELCDFEIHEIMEAVDNIRKYQAGRKESQKIDMILPLLDSVNASIQQKDPASFRKNYLLLTSTCNECHRATEFSFNVVKVPEISTFSNQDFDIKK